MRGVSGAQKKLPHRPGYLTQLVGTSCALGVSTMSPSLMLMLFTLIAETSQGIYRGQTCSGSAYFNETSGECCFHCPSGHVKRYPCVKDAAKQCKKPCLYGYFIDWEQNTPQCVACVRCSDRDLVAIKPCTVQSARVCECRSGLYCATKTVNNCARCNPHKKCEPGYGVAKKGTSQSNTVCEKCPHGQYSNVSSATERCKPHTDCAKLKLRSVGKGDSTKDEQCQDPALPRTATPRNSTGQNISLRLIIHPTPTKVPAGITGNDAAAHSATASGLTAETERRTKAATIREPPASITKITEHPRGADKWKAIYTIAGIICVTALVVSLPVLCKRKICKIKMLFAKKNSFAPCAASSDKRRASLRYQDGPTESESLQRPNINHSPEVTRESQVCRRVDLVLQEKERLLEDKAELVNTRIDNIYIMKADTVLVGSISEAANRHPPALKNCESHPMNITNGADTNARYPEQESSTVPVNELMFSVEEEGKRCVQSKSDTEY